MKREVERKVEKKTLLDVVRFRCEDDNINDERRSRRQHDALSVQCRTEHLQLVCTFCL